MTKLSEHPIAALFPMMTADELQELAEDIKANGQIETIKLNADGSVIVDGRNRLAACKIAKIEPSFEKLSREDETAYIISANIARRHMSAGARAMVAAKIFPEQEKRGGRPDRGKQSSAAKDCFPMVSDKGLSLARMVGREAPDLADAVIAGSLSLDKAAVQAKDRRDLASSAENKMAMLRSKARDLAELVKEERMEVDEALAAMKERERKNAEIIEHGRQAAETGLSRFLADVASIAAAAQIADEQILAKGENPCQTCLTTPTRRHSLAATIPTHPRRPQRR